MHDPSLVCRQQNGRRLRTKVTTPTTSGGDWLPGAEAAIPSTASRRAPILSGVLLAATCAYWLN
jgi:hypothetical protein